MTKRLTEYLDSNKIKYITISHSIAYTSQEVAASAHIPGNELAKTIILKADGKFIMAVLPASHKIKFGEFKKLIEASEVRLAQEHEFMDKFPDCEVGAMPPFGNLYEIDVYVSKSLTHDEEIFFNACEHNKLIKMSFEDFNRLVKPKILEFSYLTKL
jgi:Ala-tRNA(Pro) deacylase